MYTPQQVELFSEYIGAKFQTSLISILKELKQFYNYLPLEAKADIRLGDANHVSYGINLFNSKALEQKINLDREIYYELITQINELLLQWINYNYNNIQINAEIANTQNKIAMCSKFLEVNQKLNETDIALLEIKFELNNLENNLIQLKSKLTINLLHIKSKYFLFVDKIPKLNYIAPKFNVNIKRQLLKQAPSFPLSINLGLSFYENQYMDSNDTNGISLKTKWCSSGSLNLAISLNEIVKLFDTNLSKSIKSYLTTIQNLESEVDSNILNKLADRIINLKNQKQMLRAQIIACQKLHSLEGEFYANKSLLDLKYNIRVLKSEFEKKELEICLKSLSIDMADYLINNQ